VEEFNSARIRLAADMADDSQRVKALIVRAEDSRLMVDMESTRRAYTELFALNNQLIGTRGCHCFKYLSHTHTASSM
jgi:Bardet-Biedl syndrome 2 protein